MGISAPSLLPPGLDGLRRIGGASPSHRRSTCPVRPPAPARSRPPATAARPTRRRTWPPSPRPQAPSRAWPRRKSSSQQTRYLSSPPSAAKAASWTRPRRRRATRRGTDRAGVRAPSSLVPAVGDPRDARWAAQLHGGPEKAPRHSPQAPHGRCAGRRHASPYLRAVRSVRARRDDGIRLAMNRRLEGRLRCRKAADFVL